ncbi:dihydrofolate reductase-like domain-containing protein [Sporodiniella umbellata]|nr:dihydrofolate reductase-like domain-containing protein [Sporodiniella umbellata]
MVNHTLSFIAMAAAFADSGGIGIKNRLPWSIPGDWEYFEKVTTKSYGDQNLDDLKDWNNIVIMGRKSYEASPMCKIPLANRHNIILSREKSYEKKNSHKDATLATTLEEAFNIAANIAKKDTRIFLLGGQSVYEEGICLPGCSHILLTSVRNNSVKPIVCDTFFPNIDNSAYRLASHSELETFLKENNIPKGRQTFKNFEYEFLLYVRI